MSLFNILSAALLLLILAAGIVLVTGVRAASADVSATPPCGWGMERPAPPPAEPRAGASAPIPRPLAAPPRAAL